MEAKMIPKKTLSPREYVINKVKILEVIQRAQQRLLEIAETPNPKNTPTINRRIHRALKALHTLNATPLSTLAEKAEAYFKSHPRSSYCVYYVGLAYYSFAGSASSIHEYGIKINRDGSAQFVIRNSWRDYNALN